MLKATAVKFLGYLTVILPGNPFSSPAEKSVENDSVEPNDNKDTEIPRRKFSSKIPKLTHIKKSKFSRYFNIRGIFSLIGLILTFWHLIGQVKQIWQRFHQ